MTERVSTLTWSAASGACPAPWEAVMATPNDGPPELPRLGNELCSGAPHPVRGNIVTREKATEGWLPP